MAIRGWGSAHLAHHHLATYCSPFCFSRRSFQKTDGFETYCPPSVSVEDLFRKQMALKLTATLLFLLKIFPENRWSCNILPSSVSMGDLIGKHMALKLTALFCFSWRSFQKTVGFEAYCPFVSHFGKQMTEQTWSRNQWKRAL